MKYNGLSYIRTLPESFRDDYIKLLPAYISVNTDGKFMHIYHSQLITAMLDKYIYDNLKLCIDSNPLEWISYKNIVDSLQFFCYFHNDLHEVTRNSVIGLLNSLAEVRNYDFDGRESDICNKLRYIVDCKIKLLAKQYPDHFIKYHKFINDHMFYVLFSDTDPDSQYYRKLVDLCDNLSEIYAYYNGKFDIFNTRTILNFRKYEWNKSNYSKLNKNLSEIQKLVCPKEFKRITGYQND